jgi:hypothetical protein
MAKDKGGHGSEARSVPGGTYGGKPVFHGVNSGGKVRNAAGNIISYASPEAAVAGAGIGAVDKSSKTWMGQGSDPAPVAAHQAGVEDASRGLMSDSQLGQLRTAYAGIKTVDPSQPSYGKLTALLDGSGPERIKQLAGANIKFVSSLARNRLPKGQPTGNASPMSRAYQKSIGKH